MYHKSLVKVFLKFVHEVNSGFKKQKAAKIEFSFFKYEQINVISAIY